MIYLNYMQDDDKQPSFERLDETKVEKNHRSVFDWLRGREETEETEGEKLRKKIDEELKEAARKRATDFEEERRQEEQREVGETRKLKKRWRAKLVEKSRQILEDAAERGDEPTSGYEIAKLMVAERIVKLHDMLSDESIDLRRSEIKALKIHIDFMGLLSEKLDKPELEVPEEVQQLYQTIADSVEETTGEHLPHAPVEQEVPPQSEADISYNQFAASIVQAIERTLRREEKGVTAGSDVEPSDGGAERLLSVVKKAALSAEVIRHEISHEASVRHLAETAEKVVLAPTRRGRLSAILAPVLAFPATVRYEKASKRAHEEKSNITETRDFTLLPNKKVKYFTEIELIQFADQVEVAAGRRLSDIYKKGEIDREGLIKVLESFRKGLDYRSEFTFRRDKWQRHKKASPEYLSEPSGNAPSPRPAPVATQPLDSPKRPEDSSGSSEAPAPEKDVKTPPTPRLRAQTFIRHGEGMLRSIGRSIALPPTEKMRADLAKIANEARARLKRQGNVVVLFTTVLLVIILVLIVIQLNIG